MHNVSNVFNYQHDAIIMDIHDTHLDLELEVDYDQPLLEEHVVEEYACGDNDGWSQDNQATSDINVSLQFQSSDDDTIHEFDRIPLHPKSIQQVLSDPKKI